MEDLINESYDLFANYKLKKETFLNKGLTGIINIGNKCYSDSILQCLHHSLKLSDYFLSNQFKNDRIDMYKNENVIVAHAYQQEFLLKIRESSSLFNPRMFYNSLYKYLEKYNNLQQHDSHEFLVDFLDLLHKSISYPVKITISGQVQNETDTVMVKYYTHVKETFKDQYSFLIELFNGFTLNSIECNNVNCKYESDHIFENFNSIQLPLQTNQYLLSECLEEYFTKSIINDWVCEKCNNTSCIKELKLFTLPNYLIINLKRFDNQCNKLQNLIDFPLHDLDLTKYIHKKKKDPNNYVYSLYAVNYYSGNGKSGHYWTCFKNGDNWYISNDGNISKLTFDKSTIVTPNAYILFYYRKFLNSS